MQRKSGVRKTGASSKIRIMGTSRPHPDMPGPSKLYSKVLKGKSLEQHRLQTKEDLRTELSAMDSESKKKFIRLHNLAADKEWEDMDEDSESSLSINIDGVMDGSELIELSHAGGELHESIEDDLEEEIVSSKQWDWRTRRNRTEDRNQGFKAQMPEMLKGYMRWCASEDSSDEVDSSSAELWTITVVDMFQCEKRDVSLDPRGNGVVPALIMSGLIPCAPWKPSVAVTVRVLEMYRIAHARCPQFAIQSFVKTLCDLYETPYLPYLRKQFSVCYDLYLDLRRNTEKTVLASLGRDSFAWRIKHVCPSCMYKLEGEDKLIFEILVNMDGGNSLKQAPRRERVESDGDMGTNAKFVVGKSKEHVDSRDAGDGYYLDREKVNEWAKHRIAEMLPMEAAEGEDVNPCADRWKNMVEDITAKMWGIFDETGIFLCLCHHGFVLVICDMIKSGELSKYPLAVTDCLIEHLGQSIGNGYDVGCDFRTTIKKSPLAARAAQCNFRCLVGAFHGHAHNRLCQLRNLATYVLGLGCEDLEGCERFFSGSNALAKSCRYASRFHRQQEITAYVKHHDSSHTYANLRNYKQAVETLKKEDTLLRWMDEKDITSFDAFRIWLEEEKEFLLGLKAGSKDQTETLEMEYVQKLVNLDVSCAKYVVVAAESRKAQGDNASYTPGGASQAERARLHAKEKVDRDLDAVQELEEKLEISDRWTTESPKWMTTVAEIKQKKYQKALDAVELLVVERIFELTKMNQSQTGKCFRGYKLRKHIAKALQARSKAVRNAIDRYNDAAMALDPPMPSLTWEQVVEYTFLADFDILRDTRVEVQSRPWTRPAYRLAMDTYFKIERAKEEITRLNIEIRRLVTWIRDEEGKTEEQAEADLLLAVQMKLYRRQRSRFDDQHMEILQKLAKMKGFTGNVSPGQAVEALGESEEMEEMEVDDDREAEAAQADSDQSEDEGIEVQDETVSDLLYQVSMISLDDRSLVVVDQD
ncbi:hypothetical protein DFH08DRAFT_996667 [Mycena albidolilacea]|uniref:CxC1-like cysteine cluster associated with KDZ transposases domain-containing protein n=1 Tax=Mycena albidolilacea TaxID=1033008 RepID=A0AAD7ETC3_9AGAR|nr:hypothetical protein DFH08DRAFT_996667 [Mycena albidolilacea]